ncbi:Golgi SNAP receptor complex member 1 [Intoshia linei]|uniref:Golgi SNAP receptor complex member 1 n=1 Tax=Intoshia linei TaxID=1819745 RepID=A0A177AXQ2_9BILA|nr:Golgi SNAP receptor complex member 1 [Intoshia linei]
MTYSWSDYRQQTRSLETKVESQLNVLSQLSNYFSNAYISSRNNEIDVDENEKYKKSYLECCNKIDNLLYDLTHLINKMQDGILNDPKDHNISGSLQRHTEILQDYENEYNRTKNNITKNLNRLQTLSSALSRNFILKEMNDEKALLLTENEMIQNSQKMVENHISIAIASRENLRSQTNNLNRIEDTIGRINLNSPRLQSMLRMIYTKKRKNTIILASIIVICIIFLILYATH